jgi:hypothetical protein
MSDFLILTSNEGQKIIARLIRDGDKWGDIGQFVWEEGEIGIEFYLSKEYITDKHDFRNCFYSKLGGWISRWGIDDFIETANEDGKIELWDGKWEYILSKTNTDQIIKWLELS